MDYQIIGNNIRKLRLGRNLTQETFSEAIGMQMVVDISKYCSISILWAIVPKQIISLQMEV